MVLARNRSQVLHRRNGLEEVCVAGPPRKVVQKRLQFGTKLLRNVGPMWGPKGRICTNIGATGADSVARSANLLLPVPKGGLGALTPPPPCKTRRCRNPTERLRVDVRKRALVRRFVCSGTRLRGAGSTCFGHN